MTDALDETMGSGVATSLALKAVAVLALVVSVSAAQAASSTAAKIQSCTDAHGQRIFADPSDPRCFKPPPSADEQAIEEDRRRKERDAYQACKTEQRSQQSLLSRYPDKARHDAARKAALSQIETSLQLSQARMEQLKAERKRLLDEAEFYPSGNLPPKLRRDLDANSALIEAQTQAIVNQRDEAAQKNAFYDQELAKLQTLWMPQRGGTRGCVAPRD